MSPNCKNKKKSDKWNSIYLKLTKFLVDIKIKRRSLIEILSKISIDSQKSLKTSIMK